MIDDEVHRLPDLAFAGFAVADDAVGVAVDPVHLRSRRHAGRHAEALPQRSGGGIEEMHAQAGVRVAVDGAFNGPEIQGVLAGHLAGFGLILANDAAEVSHGGVDDGHGVAFGKDQPVGGSVPRILRIPPHVVVHQHGRQMGQRQGGGGVPAAGDGGHFDRQLANLDCLLMYSLCKAHFNSESNDT